ncbi:MAG: glycosyltransferase involved in cell wall biosynthesis [Flavobacteriales bacterium]|jgi:glycosyltransferase involved in cell wall biosynthesis
MKLLVILSRIPYPLEKGDKLRAYEQLKILNQEFDIHLCCLHHDNKIDSKITEQLNLISNSHTIIQLRWLARLWSLLVGFLKGKPIQVSYFHQKKSQYKINRIIEKWNPDHIYCQLIRTSEYVKHCNIPKTLDYMDALSKGMDRRSEKASFFSKIIFNYEYLRLKKYETDIFDSFNFCSIISQPDQKWINHPKNEKILIVPNGVEKDNFTSYTEVKKDYEVVFTGNMQYAPNVDAAVYLVEEIMPLVWKHNSHIRLLISGATPTNKVLSLASEQVTVTGWVKDMLDSYARSSIFIAPMRLGSGLQNKLLEAMSMKLPCITTSVANVSLLANPNENILVADTPDQLAKHIITLLNDRVLASSIAEKGHQFIAKHYNWKNSTNILSNVIHAKKSNFAP